MQQQLAVAQRDGAVSAKDAGERLEALDEDEPVSSRPQSVSATERPSRSPSIITLDDDELIVALGIHPIRCTSQGTRAKKLKPNAPRRIANMPGLQKKLTCGMKVPVTPLNEAIALRDVRVEPRQEAVLRST